MADEDRSAVEEHVLRSFEDPEILGKPLSRRARQAKRSVEGYLRGNSPPRYMQRLKEIDRGRERQRARLEHLYRKLRERHADDPEEFARRWEERARSWSFDALNELIRHHNEWYPVEANLPVDPRTGEYAGIRGRTYRRAELDADWVLSEFPARPG